MDEQITREYELAYLVNEEGDAAGLVKLLKDMGGEIRQEGPVRKTALAYEIKKQSSAWFGFVQFAMQPESAKALEGALNLRPEVLRSMLITPPTPKDRPSMGPGAAGAPGAPRPAAKPYESKAAAPASLSNEALEKKIEEILQ